MARNFDRTASQYLEVDSTPVTAAPLTLACWLWSDEGSNTKCAIYIGDKDTANNFFEILVLSTEAIRFAVRNTTTNGSITSASAVFTLSQWNSVVAVERSSSDRELYYNGSSVASGTTAVIPLLADRLSIGREGGPTPASYWDDRIAEVAIWDIDLNTAEISALSKGVSPALIRPGNLVFYAPLVRNDNDLVGALALTATNSPTFTDHTRVFNPASPSLPEAAVSGSYSMVAATGAFTLTGQAAGLLRGVKLAAGIGSFALSGQAAGLLRGYPLAAGIGAFTLTGQAAGLLRGLQMPAGIGAFSLTGQAAGLLRGYPLAAATGAFTLTGQAAGLIYGPAGGFTLPAGVGSFALAGQAAGLLRGLQMPAGIGAFSLAGQAAGLLRGVRLGAEVGAFNLTGQAAGLLRGYPLIAGAGSFTLTGQAINFSTTRLLGAGIGTFALTGQAVILTVVLLGAGVPWTLQARSIAWTLQARDLSWTLQARDLTWTLDDDPR